MFRSTPNSVVGSLNSSSSSSIETTYSLGSSTNSLQNSCFLSLDIEDFCESYSRLKLAERDPAQDVNSPTTTTSSISNTMMRNTTIISSSLNNNYTQPTTTIELNLFETRQYYQQEDLNNNQQNDDEEEYIQSSSLSNQQVSSNYESFSKFLAFLTKQDEEQNSIFVSPRGGGVLIEGDSSSMNRIISPPRNIHASNSKFSYLSNNVADSLSIESGMNIGESALASSSPSTPTSSTTSNSILSNSNNTNPKDSKNKLASSPKRKTSTASNNSNTSSTTSSSGIPSLINTKLTKQNKTTRKRKNSSTSPSQLSMQFNFPMWTFHFSKGRSNK